MHVYSESRILIIGQGNLGLPLAQYLSEQQHDVFAVRRSENTQDTFTTVTADITQPFVLDGVDDTTFDYVFFIVSPARDNDYANSYKSIYVEGIRNTLASITGIRKRLFVVSSTRVYGHSPEIQTEHSAANLLDDNAVLLRDMELLGENSGYPCSVIRYSGLYKSGSQRMRNIARAIASGEREWPQESYSNRFNREDAVQLLIGLFEKAETGAALEPVYIGTDNACITNHQLIRFFAEQEKLELPPAPTTETAESIKGKRLKSIFVNDVITLKYPSYKEGYSLIN